MFWAVTCFWALTCFWAVTSFWNLKDFANKRQVKHTSNVLKPTTPFHTLVEFVDADNKTNDKIHTHDLTLEVNSIKNQLQTRNLDLQQSEQLMFTQPPRS